MRVIASRYSVPDRLVDLSSDTASKPSPGMYEAMIRAPVGDEQKRADPTVNALCERVAEMTGKEAATFLPSGVMCNMISLLAQCERGDEVIAADVSHLLNMEGGAPAALAGVVIRVPRGQRGTFDVDSVKNAVRRSSKKNVPRTALVAIEQTCNRGGGNIWPLEVIEGIGEFARSEGIAMHMDGARLLNASVASGIAPRKYAAPFDSVWIDLSKGLGCPVGAVLAGSRAFIDNAWIWKHRLGGAMRQAGVLAAAGMYALDRYPEQLSRDHENAKRLANGLRGLPGTELVWEVQTNMVFLNVAGSGMSADRIAEDLRTYGIVIGAESDDIMRAVTHLDVTSSGIDDAIEAMHCVLRAAA